TAGRLTAVTVPNVHNGNPFEWMLYTAVAWGDGAPPVRTYYGFSSLGPWQSPQLVNPGEAGVSPIYYNYSWALVVANWPNGILWNATLHGGASYVYTHPGMYGIVSTARYTGDDVVESDSSIAVADGSLSVVTSLPQVAAQEARAFSGVSLLTFAD